MGWFKDAMSNIPGIGGLFSIGEQIFSRTRAGYETSPEKRAFNDSVAHEQAIFERDSAYNSPAAQMERFRQAGLNPNLVYGQGTPGITQGSPVKAQPNNPTSIGQNILQSIITGKEMEMKDATIENIQANTNLVNTKAGTEEYKMLRLIQDWQYLEDNYPELLDRLRRENRIGNETESASIIGRKADAEIKDVAAGVARETQGEQIRAKEREDYIGEQTKETKIAKEQMSLAMISRQFESELMRQGLMEQDGKIRKEVLTGKKLQNAILDMQRKFVTEGKMNPQMFWQAFLNVIAGGLK